MSDDLLTAMAQVHELMDEYRQRCLWYLRPDYYPQTVSEAVRVLRAIENHGDLEAFRKASTLRQWFLRNSSGTSAA